MAAKTPVIKLTTPTQNESTVPHVCVKWIIAELPEIAVAMAAVVSLSWYFIG